MEIHNEAWLTLYEKNFDKDKFIYHFTDVDKAIKILHGNSLKFSKISKTNDTLESKPKICTTTASNTNNIIKHFRELNKLYIQLLCFTKDEELDTSNTTPVGKLFYTDYSGRGFALPRMWAQYAKNNTGICFVFDKNKLKQLIYDEVGIGLIHDQSIRYINKFDKYDIDQDKLNKLLDQVSLYDSKFQKDLFSIAFLKKNIEFTEYNYFTKLSDWSGESEYRFLAFGADDFYVKNIHSTIIGIVIGENIEPAYESILKNMCNDLCEIKKIIFSYEGCKITTVN